VPPTSDPRGEEREEDREHYREEDERILMRGEMRGTKVG